MPEHSYVNLDLWFELHLVGPAFYPALALQPIEFIA